MCLVRPVSNQLLEFEPDETTTIGTLPGPTGRDPVRRRVLIGRLYDGAIEFVLTDRRGIVSVCIFPMLDQNARQ